METQTDVQVIPSQLNSHTESPALGDTPMKKIELSLDTNERQERYVKKQEAHGGGSGIVFADAFIRGMRDIGYKNPAWAIAEMMDNSIQAGATTIEVRLGFDAANKSRAKPDQIAIIDNGAGMIPKMVSYAVRWGGTDRENDRQGFGRYGYGLPSSAVSMARKYTVYAKTAGGSWHAVTVDLEALGNAANDAKKTEALLAPKPVELPSWLIGYERKGPKQLDLASLKSGTVIVLEDLDRLRALSGWITTKAFEAKLLQYFGVIYRHWLNERTIIVNNTTTEAVDPLFLMQKGRFYDETPVMAKPIANRAFETTSSSGEKGVVRIRAALLPPDFQLVNPKDFAKKGAKTNKRFDVMKDYNGLMICREGRQIDCITPDWTRFQVYDRNLKIEVDFDPVLDEYFGITTSKQQIVIDDSMWEKLKQEGKESGGLLALVKDMRGALDQMREELDSLAENAATTDEPRPSGQAMADAERFRVRRPTPSPEQVEQAKDNLEREAERIAQDEHKSKEEAKRLLEQRTDRLRWEVEFSAIEEGPFFIPKRLGQQKRIVINTAHPFYSKVYNQASGIKAALEVLLFVLADGEIDSQGEREEFYKNERISCWSPLLKHALNKLVDDSMIADKASAKES